MYGGCIVTDSSSAAEMARGLRNQLGGVYRGSTAAANSSSPL
jgi:hypothetical protein